MDYVSEAENYLRHYASLKRSVAHAEYMIKQIIGKSCPGEVGAVVNDITGISTQHPVNTMQEIYELKKWQAACADSQRELEHIADLLEGLDERERKILKMFYIDRMPVADIAVDMNFDTRQAAYNLKSKALKNFSVNLFGIDALKAI